jgi:hypothetical protein
MHERFINDDCEAGEMTRRDFEITRISDGLRFGDGQITGQDEPEVLARTDEAIQQAEILVPIDRDDNREQIQDDGCGDGRGVKFVYRRKEILKRSLNRAKVFGGSVVMTAASLIGVGDAGGRPLNEVFDKAVDSLETKGMDFGAHTDEYATGENCGCGAIDRAPEALVAALKYEKSIRAVIKLLGVDTTELDNVYANFRRFFNEMPKQSPYSGRKVMERIVGAGKVVKELAGIHRERRIILSTVRGYTVNQALVRQATDGRAQAFAVDVWRLEDIATNLYAGNPVKQSQAFLSELVYTLAISAVLTKGDLPVDTIQLRPSAVAV